MPLITRPTRFTEVSSTLIDNIITNTFNECSSAGVLIADTSFQNNLPIFYISNEPATIDTLVNENIFHSNINDINIIKFKDALTDVQLNDDMELNDVKSCYENFIRKFSGLYDKYFPKQRKRVIARNRNKPWITQGILFSIKTKHRYYKLV